MARKGWNQLSDAYRKRLEKGGVTKGGYESGASIRKARGHENTPERPTAKAQPSSYAARRKALIDAIWNVKDAEATNKREKYDPTRARLVIEFKTGEDDIVSRERRGITELRAIIKEMLKETSHGRESIDLASGRSNAEYRTAFFYH